MKDDIIFDLVSACEAISQQVVLKSHAIATSLGLSPSDFSHLSLLVQSGPMTAGSLANRTGLTTGAITGVIDRLEENGFVTRQPDRLDRRRIIIVPSEDIVRQISAINKKSYAGFHRCLADYSPKEKMAILTFLQTTTDFLHQETARIITHRK